MKGNYQTGLYIALFLVVSLVQAPQGYGETVKILLFGDSLSSGYGLPKSEDGLAPRLTEDLRKNGLDATVINAGIAGDTTTDGAARLAWSLEQDLDFMILALGANDMLRSLPVSLIRSNLDSMLATLAQKQLPTLLVGMRAPPNYGATYRHELDQAYLDLAKDYDVPLYPFLLEGVATQKHLNQIDGIHPNAQGVAIIASRLAPVVLEALNKFSKVEPAKPEPAKP